MRDTNGMRDFSNLWAKVLENTQSSFEEVKRLVFVRLVLQLSSAVNERGFSRLKLIKTYLRAQMSNDLLDWLMLISIEAGAELSDKTAVDDICLRALIRWKALKQRVPQRGNPGQTRKRQKTAGASQVESAAEFLASVNEGSSLTDSAASGGGKVPRTALTPAPGESAVELYDSLPYSELKGLDIAHTLMTTMAGAVARFLAAARRAMVMTQAGST